MPEVNRGYYDSGQLRYEIPYNQDRQHGIQKGWYKNGQPKYEVPYYQGIQHGIGKYWYDNGQLQYEKYYLYGKEVTEEEYRKYELIEKLACLK